MADDKDVPMEDVTEVDEDELLGKNGEEQDETMKDESAETKADGEEEEKKEDETNKEEEEKKKEEELDDGGAASDVEFSAEDDRAATSAEESSWKWHIEIYPLAPEDVMLDNFVKMLSTAASSHIVFRDNELGEKRGEAHFYTQDLQVAQTLMRTICCRKFTFFRPFIYLYHLKDGSQDEYETAYLRLDLIESAKMRWDRLKRNKGEATSRVAKVSNVPLDTSKDFLKVLFARAFLVKQESDQSEEEAKKAKEATENDEPKAESSTAVKTEEKDDQDEDKEENKEEAEEELVGEFNGNLSIDCSTRTSLKGFLLGYRKIIIADSLLDIKPLAEDLDVDAVRKEVRKKRAYEAIHGKEWKPVTAADRYGRRDDDDDGRPSHSRDKGRGGRGRGKGGDRGRGGRGGGGIMTGRQKMEDKYNRRGDRRNYADDMRYLQTQLAMNTYELQRQIQSLQGRDRGYRGYRDYDPYDMPMERGYGPRDDWGGYGGGRGGGGGGGPRYGGGRGKQHRGRR